MNLKSCDSLVLCEITSKIKLLRNVPLEIGNLEIEYSCLEGTEKIEVFVINTINGPRILDNVVLVFK
jgi:hypothetical protein